eukprot:730920-Rhodomonas_salina.1
MQQGDTQEEEGGGRRESCNAVREGQGAESGVAMLCVLSTGGAREQGGVPEPEGSGGVRGGGGRRRGACVAGAAPLSHTHVIRVWGYGIGGCEVE